MNPLISVIMGVYNQYDEQALKAAVSSVLDQTLGDLEFIIWDDGSDERAGALLRQLPSLDERIILAGREENRGLAFSLNECIKIARGKYIARMDADDYSFPARLEKQVAFLEDHPEYGWCGTSAELFDEDGTWGVRIMPEVPSVRDFYKYSPFIHPSVVFRAGLFFDDNGYSEDGETLRCEDYEIFMKLMKRGVRGYNLPEILFRYREDKASYEKRNIRTRFRESKIRYRNFRDMKMLFPLGWIYVLRPVAACLLPHFIVRIIKRSEGRMVKRKVDAKAYKDDRSSIGKISEVHREKTLPLSGVKKVTG